MSPSHARPLPRHRHRNTTDPGTGHLNLSTTVTVEDPTVGGCLRETGHTLPSGAASTVSTAYYGDTETADVPCPGGDTNVNQGGMVKSVTAADPDGPGGSDAVVRDTVYDRGGRPAATRVRGDGAWTCSTFDDRGRVTQVITPGLAGAPGHVETTNYTLNNNPTATAQTDTATGGTGRTFADWWPAWGRSGQAQRLELLSTVAPVPVFRPAGDGLYLRSMVVDQRCRRASAPGSTEDSGRPAGRRPWSEGPWSGE